MGIEHYILAVVLVAGWLLVGAKFQCGGKRANRVSVRRQLRDDYGISVVDGRWWSPSWVPMANFIAYGSSAGSRHHQASVAVLVFPRFDERIIGLRSDYQYPLTARTLITYQSLGGRVVELAIDKKTVRSHG